MADKEISEMSRDELLARSRTLESKMSVLRSHTSRGSEQHSGPLQEVQSESQEISKRLAEMDETPGQVDKEGTAPTLADGEGHFAPDADVANVGGIGIRDSNTNPEEVRRRMEEGVPAAESGEVATTESGEEATTETEEEGPKRRSRGR